MATILHVYPTPCIPLNISHIHFSSCRHILFPRTTSPSTPQPYLFSLCTPIPSRPLGQPHGRHPIHRIDVSRERKPLRACKGCSSYAPRHHRDAAAASSAPSPWRCSWTCSAPERAGRRGGVERSAGSSDQLRGPPEKPLISSSSVAVAVPGGEEEDEVLGFWAWLGMGLSFADGFGLAHLGLSFADGFWRLGSRLVDLGLWVWV